LRHCSLQASCAANTCHKLTAIKRLYHTHLKCIGASGASLLSQFSDACSMRQRAAYLAAESGTAATLLIMACIPSPCAGAAANVRPNAFRRCAAASSHTARPPQIHCASATSGTAATPAAAAAAAALRPATPPSLRSLQEEVSDARRRREARVHGASLLARTERLTRCAREVQVQV
jgi:hypothetical protein